MTYRFPMALRIVLAASMCCTLAACSNKEEEQPAKIKERYQTLPKREVPEYLQNSILELADVIGTDPLVVSGFGMVVDLRNTGGGPYPTAVRSYMAEEAIKRGFGSRNLPQYAHIRPSDLLRDKRTSIVRVDGYIPPGARRGQEFDIQVQAMMGSETSSLAAGQLYSTGLRIDGANTRNPKGSIHVYANAKGPIFVNPAYALITKPNTPAAKASLRQGVVLNGGVMQLDRPLMLRLRQPSRAMARRIESRIDLHFQDRSVAAAKNEALVQLIVPRRFKGDWEHFMGVVSHLYIDSSPANNIARAKRMAVAARQPDAPLLDISYAWEAMGQDALPVIRPLVTDTAPEVAYAASRAAAMLGDVAAQDALLRMAQTESHPFQLSAIASLGKLESSTQVNQMLRRLLDSPQPVVRVQAYQMLVKNSRNHIFSRVIGGQKFILDIVTTNGKPLIFATRSGVPRIALMGSPAALDLPIAFEAFDGKFIISSHDRGNQVTLYQRTGNYRNNVKHISTADLATIVARLGGEGADGELRFDFSYGDIVGMLQKLAEQDKLISVDHHQREVLARLMLQDPPYLEKVLRRDEFQVRPGGTGVGRTGTGTTTNGLPEFRPGAGDGGSAGNGSTGGADNGSGR